MDETEVLRIEQLGKRYRRFELHDITFSLNKGYIMGLIGRNGAGKSTIMRLIMNVQKKSMGKIWIDGEETRRNRASAIEKIGFVSEDNEFMMKLSLEENAKLLGRFYNHFHMDKFYQYLERFDLDKDKEITKLSKGMLTKFQLAFALSHEPSLLLMDEPTGGLDPIFRREFLSILQEVIEKEEIGILFSTHITSDLDKVADFITIINNGRLLMTDTKDVIMDRYRLVKGSLDLLRLLPKDFFLSVKKKENGFEGMTYKYEQIVGEEELLRKFIIDRPNLGDILYYLTR